MCIIVLKNTFFYASVVIILYTKIGKSMFFRLCQLRSFLILVLSFQLELCHEGLHRVIQGIHEVPLVDG